MPPPLTDGRVDYTDGSPATVDQYSKDVAAFMMWAAEPHLEARKRIGFQVMIFLIIFSGLMYFTKKKVWADVHEHARPPEAGCHPGRAPPVGAKRGPMMNSREPDTVPSALVIRGSGSRFSPSGMTVEQGLP